ncbi:malonyl-CoA:anthocyanidin 5-O-glucoside-6''-O-malonyltransferase-like [Impatiens glandulifera]|uniref:malonyl-CoA:anthocyanidin 5-O-glucoside-6''-O-malonyltransferase-like n=1 Tax=Impatiens glandulifera TaxID=253017 RepID=UPI001FB15AD4|nr:malonyl-CoA:anthocyanidin 5-O-glucoside-6''-O-malonyltransferase-like [Impatiens glandulifera]
MSSRSDRGIQSSSGSTKYIAATTISGDYLPLTFFDATWLKFQPTQRLFFYEIQDVSFSVFSDDILPKLKHALSLTLQYYPQLAGNLTWHPVTGKPVIHFAPDDGVFLTVAESTADFHSLSTHDVKEAKDMHSLLSSEFHVSENQATVLSLQVTLFPGSGFSIGYTAHHAVLSTARAPPCLSSHGPKFATSLPLELTPVLERSFINDPLDICTIFTERWKEFATEGTGLTLMEIKPEPGLLRGAFRLSRQQIGQIKSKIDAFWIAKTKVVSLEGGDGLVTAAATIEEAVGSLPQGVVKGTEKWFSETDSIGFYYWIFLRKLRRYETLEIDIC